MLHTTDLSCEVYRAVHRFANVSVTVHFIVDCWFESRLGYKTVMVKIFNGFPQCLYTGIRVVPQGGTTASFYVSSDLLPIICSTI
jgi:hypothetical protein